MYAWLVIPVALVWLWLAIGAIYAWWRRYANWFVSLCGLGLASLIAFVILVTAGPYGTIIYATLLQPG